MALDFPVRMLSWGGRGCHPHRGQELRRALGSLPPAFRAPVAPLGASRGGSLTGHKPRRSVEQLPQLSASTAPRRPHGEPAQTQVPARQLPRRWRCSWGRCRLLAMVSARRLASELPVLLPVSAVPWARSTDPSQPEDISFGETLMTVLSRTTGPQWPPMVQERCPGRAMVTRCSPEPAHLRGGTSSLAGYPGTALEDPGTQSPKRPWWGRDHHPAPSVLPSLHGLRLGSIRCLS